MARKKSAQSRDNKILKKLDSASAKPDGSTGKSLSAQGNSRQALINNVTASRAARRVVSGASKLAGSASAEDKAAADKAIARRNRRQTSKGSAAPVREVGGALAEIDEGYVTTGVVGKGRKRSGVGSGSPLDIREQNKNKINAIKRLQSEGNPEQAAFAAKAQDILAKRQARRSNNAKQVNAQVNRNVANAAPGNI